ncbi:hypothetical protein [Aliikangiella maris]|uniref:Uncharacterized protein n=2 Tax=Aliikangiella maris TaxID=3162458 RepID=A0ABV2BX27_9GAMM
MKKLLILISFLVVAWQLLFKMTTELGPGVKAPLPPFQGPPSGQAPINKDGYLITELASFSINAKVLSKEFYFLGREADLSPVDLALGWGRMSDESVLSQIDISQSGRWYRWQSKNFAIPRREIETSSANMHMIPADNEIKLALSRVKEGQIIQLTGSLVKVEANDGWRWKSSLTREDTGNGACELIYVKHFSIVDI